MRKVPISDIAIPVLGGTPKRGISSYWNGFIKWATAKDVVNNKGRYLFSTAETITEEGLNNSAAKILPKGPVIITARGTVGAIAQLDENMAFNQTCYGLIPKDTNKIDQDYLYYTLKASIQEMRAVSYGTVFDTITMKSFDEIQIPLPPLPEQKAIAHILGTLDDKIELNRRMNETLEEMAKAIFKSWFVDFDPMIDNALKAGNPIPDALAEKATRRRAISTPKLSPEIARLFPDSFEDSPFGPIPKGWSKKLIKEEEVAQTIRGRSYKSSELSDSDTALITLKSIARGGGYRPDGLKPFIGSYKREQVVSPGELVIACTDVTQAGDVIGKPAIVQEDKNALAQT